MKVFKFGGASVKDANAVRNVSAVLKLYPNDKLVVVVSAMGKTTNAFEHLLDIWYSGKDTQQALQNILEFHQDIIDSLFFGQKPSNL